MRDDSSSGKASNVTPSCSQSRNSHPHPYAHLFERLNGFDESIYNIQKLGKDKVCRLPHCIRVLLESAVRNCDGFLVTQDDVERILDWDALVNHKRTDGSVMLDVPFIPARVILQDFTGVPCVVDLAAMRDAMVELGSDPLKINPRVPVDLIIDHSVQVDRVRSKDAVTYNEEMEMHRNSERFSFLKWAAKTFSQMLIVPPGSGIVHQVNLEYLAKVVVTRNGVCFPDSLVGTDSHTTMIDGLGIVGWGVGGIEAEATMLGQPISMTLPPVLGVRLVGRLSPACTTTDLVLHVARILRMRGVVDHFVEFFGEACASLSAPDRATLANMSPEFGATIAYFPPDEMTLKYLLNTGRSTGEVEKIKAYLLQQGMFRTYENTGQKVSYTDVLEVDLSKIEPCIAGPKRPQDEVLLRNLKREFIVRSGSLRLELVRKPSYMDGSRKYLQGSVVIAAITSCTNTSNPSVMVGAGLLARKAVDLGLSVAPYIKTSLSPGSHVVQRYLESADLLPALEELGFYLTGFGCMTCIGNSGDLPEEVTAAIQSSPDLVVSAVLSGRVDIDFETEPLGICKNGKEVFLRDIWPSPSAVNEVVEKVLLPSLFKEAYQNIQQGNERSATALQQTIFHLLEESRRIHLLVVIFLLRALQGASSKSGRNGFENRSLESPFCVQQACAVTVGCDLLQLYRETRTPLIVIAGVKAVIAESYERIHRSNLVGMGVLPLQFLEGESASSLGITGMEEFSIDLTILGVNSVLPVQLDDGRQFSVKCRLQTKVELEYFRNGGILQYVLRNAASESTV
ncbi:aconitate hydratase, putative [Eimeria brunetti]|uniref:aconitate hydratase n=1 Tax=Eimeria brunetti TaxID=51314 RepID=U6LD99_9EIME|nr:aconitate hydratase, putative [Eimeria brunetti]